MRNLRLLSFLILPLVLLFLASCSSDDDPVDPGTTPDTTAPLVVQVDPSQSETDVGVGEDVTISFNEAMSADSADGQITFSQGTASNLTWSDTQTLVVEHTDWPEGTEITATVGTGLADAAGNTLAEPFTWSFITYTSETVLLGSLPADGATDVPLNSQVLLTFSRRMNGTTLPGAITVTSPDRTDHTFTGPEATDEDGEIWRLTFDADLPAATEITVNISTDAQDSGGTALASAASFSFTTGTVADETAPELLSVEPATGATIATSTSYVRMTFSEPIDTELMEPSLISGGFLFSMSEPGSPGVWSENNTVFTLGLSTPLVSGSIFRVVFDSFTDLNGNVNNEGYDWQVTVGGTADYMPLLDNLGLIYLGTITEETSRADTYQALRYQKLEELTGGEFRLWSYEEGVITPRGRDIPWTDYERYRLTSSAVQFLGFHEEDEGEDPLDITFDPAVTWLPLPVATGTWSGHSTFTEPEAGELQLDYDAAVLAGTVDLVGPNMDDIRSPQIHWLGCRCVVLNYTIGDGSETYESGQDTLWYAPGLGVVKEVSTTTDSDGTTSSDFRLQYMTMVEDDR